MGENKVAYTVPKLKDYSPVALEVAGVEILAALELEARGVHDSDERKAFRDRWLGRKNGILTQINDPWLKPAPKDAKREVGPLVNKLKTKAQPKTEAPPPNTSPTF